jgi:outer membrane protein assembly factor BamB
VVALLATFRTTWAERRRILLMTMVLCAAFFCFTRITGVDGTMAPLIAWRWSGPPELGATTNANAKTAALPSSLEPEDWPAFRGARRDNRNMVSRFGVEWETAPPKELWRRPVGLGWSSFAVVGEYLFTQEQRGAEEAVVCYEAATGNEVWSNLIPERFDEVMGSGPRATPAFDKGKLYTQGATGILQCIDAATGATLWKRDLKEDAAMGVPKWGFSSSPLVTGELVVVYAGAGDGKSVLAYKKDSGEPAWTAGNGRNGYSSPHWAEVALAPQILQISNYGIEAFEPTTGKLLWEDKWDIKNNPRVAQPYVVDFYTLIAGTGQGKGARLLKVVKEGEVFVPKILWTSDDFRPYFNDYVFHDGYLYGFDGNRFVCVDALNGFLRWKGERWGGQLLALNEIDMLLVLTEEGEVILVSAYPSHIEIKGRVKALDSKTWNHPVVSRGKLYVRNDREAVCYELPPAAAKEEKPKPGEH